MSESNSSSDHEGIGAKGWLLVVSAVLLIAFCIINSQRVKVHFVFATVHLPLIIALLIAAVLGALVGWAIPRLRGSGG